MCQVRQRILESGQLIRRIKSILVLRQRLIFRHGFSHLGFDQNLIRSDQFNMDASEDNSPGRAACGLRRLLVQSGCYAEALPLNA